MIGKPVARLESPARAFGTPGAYAAAGIRDRLVRNIQKYAVGIGEYVLAYGAGLQIFLELTALHSDGDFFRGGLGKGRCDFVQIFLGFFYALDFKADMIEALP